MRIRSWNRAAEQLYGISADVVLGRPFADFISCDPHHPIRRRGRHRPPDLIGLVNGPATHVVQSGRTLAVCVSVMVFRRRSGARHYVAVVTDDTCLLYTSPSPRDRQKSR